MVAKNQLAKNECFVNSVSYWHAKPCANSTNVKSCHDGYEQYVHRSLVHLDDTLQPPNTLPHPHDDGGETR